MKSCCESHVSVTPSSCTSILLKMGRAFTLRKVRPAAAMIMNKESCDPNGIARGDKTGKTKPAEFSGS